MSRPERPVRQTRLRVGTALAAVVVAALVAGAGPAWGWWADDASLSTGTTTATTVLRPDGIACASGTPLPLSARVSWPAKSSLYEYEVVLRRTTAPAGVVSTRVVSGTSTTYTGLLDFGLVVGAGTVDFAVDVRSRLVATPTWASADTRSYASVRVFAIAVGATATCTT